MIYGPDNDTLTWMIGSLGAELGGGWVVIAKDKQGAGSEKDKRG